MNIFVLTYWSYKDPLIQTYTLPYLKLINDLLPEGSKIFLLTFEQPFYSIGKKEYRTIIENLSKQGIYLISYKYSKLGFLVFIRWIYIIIRLVIFSLKNKIKFIHAWCTPAGAVGYIISKLINIPLIIDSYEPHAESMVENKMWNKNGLVYRILFFFEKLQTKRAKVLIAAAGGMRDYARKKYKVNLPDFYVKPACVNLEQFSYRNIHRKELINKFGFQDKIVCVYAGKLGGIYLDKEVFDFFKIASEYWGNKFRVLLLTSHTNEEINKYAEASNLDNDIISTEFVPHKDIADYLGIGSFGITPVKPIPTKKYCTPIKNGEYWALGLPVVITEEISDDSEIIEKYKIGAVIKGLNNESYLQAIKKIDKILKDNSRKELYRKIRPVAEGHRNFSIANNIYKIIYTQPNI